MGKLHVEEVTISPYFYTRHTKGGGVLCYTLRTIFPEPKRRFIAQSLSCSPFHRLEMTEILFKGRKTLTNPFIHPNHLNVRPGIRRPSDL